MMTIKKLVIQPMLVGCCAVVLILCAGFCQAACLCQGRGYGVGGAPVPATTPYLEVSPPTGDDTLMICTGHNEDGKGPTKFEMSEFEVDDCKSKDILAVCSAAEDCRVEAKNHELSFTRTIRIPRRPNDWVKVPYSESSIRWINSHWQTGNERGVFKAPKMSTDLIQSLLTRFQNVKKNGCAQDVLANDAEFAGLLMVAAGNGSQSAREAFLELRTMCHMEYRGAAAEAYDDFQKVLLDRPNEPISK